VLVKNLLRNIPAALLMGLTWAVVWAPVGPLTGLIVDPNESMDEQWIVVGAYPGFLCGLIFFTVLRIAEGPHGLDTLSRPRATGWGAVSGLLLPALFALFIAAGGGTMNVPVTLTWVSVVTGITTLLGAVAASVSLALARWRRNHLMAANARSL
jgi:hypothetical protein